MFDICLIASSGEHWEKQWSYVLSNFEPQQLYIIGDASLDIRPFRGHRIISTADELPVPLIVMSPFNAVQYPGRTALPSFQHPPYGCYLFGSDNTHLTSDQMGTRVPEDLVYIPTNTKDNMYSFIAGAITLYDRRVKNG